MALYASSEEELNNDKNFFKDLYEKIRNRIKVVMTKYYNQIEKEMKDNFYKRVLKLKPTFVLTIKYDPKVENKLLKWSTHIKHKYVQKYLTKVVIQ